MVYVLVDRGDNIVDRKDLSDDIGVGGARTFFIGRKQIDENKLRQQYGISCSVILSTCACINGRPVSFNIF